MSAATAHITAEIDHPERRREAALAAARNCSHADTTESGPRCYTGSVAEPPYTDENPAAHGNIEVTETCRRCSPERFVLINGQHLECGCWHPPTAEIYEAARYAP